MTKCQRCFEQYRDILANAAIVLGLEGARVGKFLDKKEKEIYGVHAKAKPAKRKIHPR